MASSWPQTDATLRQVRHERLAGGESSVRYSGEERIGDGAVHGAQRLPNDALEFVAAPRTRRRCVEVYDNRIAAADREKAVRKIRSPLGKNGSDHRLRGRRKRRRARDRIHDGSRRTRSAAGE